MFRYDLIWEKPLGTGHLNANRMPLRSHESILIFYKSLPVYNPQKEPGRPYKLVRTTSSDTPNYNEFDYPNRTTDNETGDRYPKSVLRFNHESKKVHPTQKPVALVEWLIRTYTNEGDLILDSTAGSFTTAVAAIRTNRNYICIEKEEKYCNIGRERVDEAIRARENRNIQL